MIAEDGITTKVSRCAYAPHSLRAAPVTMLLDAEVDIILDDRDRVPLGLAPLPDTTVGGDSARRRSS